jgi:ribosome-associated protein
MDIRKLQRAIVDGLEDVKAQHIAVFDTEHLSPLFERVIIASGTSHRQTKALASSVRETVRSRGLPVLRVEGEDNGEWIIVDCGAAVAHIMQPSIRDYYRLEEIWGGKPVRVKLGNGGAGGVPKAAEPEPPAVRVEVAARAAGRAQAAGKAGARAVAAQRGVATGAAANKVTAKKPAAKKATAKQVAAKKAAARKPVARAPAVERIVVKPRRAAGAGKAAAQTAKKTAKKPAARRSPAPAAAGAPRRPRAR